MAVHGLRQYVILLCALVGILLPFEVLITMQDTTAAAPARIVCEQGEEIETPEKPDYELWHSECRDSATGAVVHVVMID